MTFAEVLNEWGKTYNESSDVFFRRKSWKSSRFLYYVPESIIPVNSLELPAKNMFVDIPYSENIYISSRFDLRDGNKISCGHKFSEEEETSDDWEIILVKDYIKIINEENPWFI